MRTLIILLFICTLSACDEPASDLPNQSYTFPTAIIGVPVESPSEAAAVRSVIKQFAEQYGLVRYRRKDAPFFAEECRKAPRTCPDEYNPPNPRMQEGFAVVLNEFSPRCFIIELLEYSGVWTRRSLDAVQVLQARLMTVTESRARLLVRPKREQNWSEQIRPYHGREPERPTFREELCVRMGVPDPRSSR